MFAQFAKASRLSILPVILIPVVLGVLGAFVWNETFDVWLLLLTLLGVAAAHLFSNMVNDLWDYKNGTDTAAVEEEDAISSHSGFLTSGTWSLRTFSTITWSLFGLAVICGVILIILSGWWVLVIGLLGAFFAYFYVAPPIRFGYRGKGYGEVAILLSFGVLPVVGAYYVQTSQLDVRAFLLSLPIGLLTTLILFNHSFLHWRSDKRAGKNTLVVVWGQKKALAFSKGLLTFTAIIFVMVILFGALPWYAVIALLTFIPLYRMYGQLKDENPSVAYGPLMGASVSTSMRCGYIMLAALLIQGLL